MFLIELIFCCWTFVIFVIDDLDDLIFDRLIFYHLILMIFNFVVDDEVVWSCVCAG